MNILVIGNGFDLAHGLPTKYDDFLEFCKVIKEILNKKHSYNIRTDIDWGKINPKIKDLIIEETDNRQNNLFSQEDTWLNLIQDNIWLEYFYQNKYYINENWIDFESEISNVIQSLDKDMDKKEVTRNKIDDNITELSNEFMRKYYSDYLFTVQSVETFITETCSNISYREIRDKLLEDLNNLIKALEMYLYDYVKKIEILDISGDIKNIHPDKVLSFNYTDTFEREYGSAKAYEYIHGKAKKSHDVNSNMVLGIDEYLPDDRRKDIDFIAFKKFYQRIYKETGCLYRDWVGEIKEDWDNATVDSKREIKRRISQKNFDHTVEKLHKLYIFGHSFDTADKNILKDIILNDNIHTTIFYYNKDIYGKQIANLTKVIGPDELIKRTGGPTKTITFMQQQEFVSKSSIYQGFIPVKLKEKL